jgi:transposase-like protein
MAEGRRKFPEEFEREAVKLASQPGVTFSYLARDLGVDVSDVRRWAEKSRAGKW